MNNLQLEEFYNDLSNDADFIAYQHQKQLEWMERMNEHYQTLEKQKNLLVESEEVLILKTNQYDLDERITLL
jgi:hypothetical protein